MVEKVGLEWRDQMGMREEMGQEIWRETAKIKSCLRDSMKPSTVADSKIYTYMKVIKMK